VLQSRQRTGLVDGRQLAEWMGECWGGRFRGNGLGIPTLFGITFASCHMGEQSDPLEAGGRGKKVSVRQIKQKPPSGEGGNGQA